MPPGEEVWKLAADGEWSRPLLDAALSRRVNSVPAGGTQPPEAFLIRYRDGLKAAVLANGIMLAGLESRRQRGKWIDTPELSLSYS
jgi:hypothetical protein